MMSALGLGQFRTFATYPGIDVRATVGMTKHESALSSASIPSDGSGLLATTLSRSNIFRAHGDFGDLRIQRPQRQRL